MIGQHINNYRIVSVLGEGGMGTVYLAEHPFMGRKAAIKVLRRELAEDRDLVDRFMNEARAANAIRHPNIIDIIDVGTLPSGLPYLMMEYLDGESLGKRLERRRLLPIAEAIDVAAQTASALAAAHEKNIVHRDLKPDNLFLIPERGNPTGRIKVLDFGIAKLRGELSSGASRTKVGAILGTPPYMSPEQCRGVGELDQRTDVYALGIILYEMLTGAPPFVSAGWGEVVHMHISQAPLPPRAMNPAISPELEAVVLKALAKQRHDRWGSMGELESALREIPLTDEATRPDTNALPPPTTGPGGTAILSPQTTLRASAGQITAADGPSVAGGVAAIGESRGRRPIFAIGGLALAVVVAGAVGLGLRHAPAPAAGGGPAPIAAFPHHEPAVVSPPRPEIMPAVTNPEPAVLAPAVSASGPPPPADLAPAADGSPPAARASGWPHRKKAAVTKPSHRSSPAGTGAAAPAPAAATAQAPAKKKSDCTPNYYFDAQARKHFKPECF